MFSLIANPISGKGRALRLAQAVQAELLALGQDVDLLPTQKAGHGKELAQRCEAGVVVACGGDGTLAEVLAGLSQRPAGFLPVGIAPAGVGNVVAKEFGLPRQAADIARCLAKGALRKVDLGHLQTNTGEARPFSFLVSCGFDAEVVRRISLQRSGSLALMAYARHALGGLLDADHFRMSVTVDGRLVTADARYIAIANMSSYGGPIRVVRDARTDDGLLEVLLLTKPLGRRFLTILWRALNGGLDNSDDAIRLQGREVRVESLDLVAVQADGDLAGSLPLVAKIRQTAWELVVPS